VNRFVVGPNAENRSAGLRRGLTNGQFREGFYWRATLWVTQETPVDNAIDGDRSQTPGLGARREPFPNGLICRRDLSQMWTRLAGQSEAELIVGLKETPAENATQAGVIFAEPGHEQPWLDENRARLTEFGLL
jgi:hypothetical protein